MMMMMILTAEELSISLWICLPSTAHLMQNVNSILMHISPEASPKLQISMFINELSNLFYLHPSNSIQIHLFIKHLFTTCHL